MSVSDRPTGCKYTPFSRNGSGAGPGSPPHPTHAAIRPAMTGSMAVTRPRATPPAAHPIGIDNTVNGETVCGTHQIERRPSYGHEPSPPCSRVRASPRAELVSAMSPPGNKQFRGHPDESMKDPLLVTIGPVARSL